MSKLIYAALTSLDGYIADEIGNFDWAEPKEDVHTFVNKLEMENGTLLLGREMYSILSFWEEIPEIEKQPAYIKEYQRAWEKSKKIVFTKSLTEIKTSNTIFKRDLIKSDIESIKSEETRNIGIGGANIASQVLAFGLIDEVYQFIFPIMIGSGKKWLTNSEIIKMETIEIKEFENGVVMLHFRVING